MWIPLAREPPAANSSKPMMVVEDLVLGFVLGLGFLVFFSDVLDVDWSDLVVVGKEKKRG